MSGHPAIIVAVKLQHTGSTSERYVKHVTGSRSRNGRPARRRTAHTTHRCARAPRGCGVGPEDRLARRAAQTPRRPDRPQRHRRPPRRRLCGRRHRLREHLLSQHHHRRRGRLAHVARDRRVAHRVGRLLLLLDHIGNRLLLDLHPHLALRGRQRGRAGQRGPRREHAAALAVPPREFLARRTRGQGG